LNTQEALKQYISTELLSDRSNVNLTVDDSLLVGGLVDSLGIMRLVNFIEEHFNIRVPPEHVTIEHFRSIRVIAEYIESRISTAVTAQN